VRYCVYTTYPTFCKQQYFFYLLLTAQQQYCVVLLSQVECHQQLKKMCDNPLEKDDIAIGVRILQSSNSCARSLDETAVLRGAARPSRVPSTTQKDVR
jgi:hypothetical protein